MLFFLHKSSEGISADYFKTSNDDDCVVGEYANDKELYDKLPEHIKYYIYEAYIDLYDLNGKGYIVFYDGGYVQYCEDMDALINDLDCGFNYMKKVLYGRVVFAKENCDNVEYNNCDGELHRMYDSISDPEKPVYDEWVKE